MYEVYLDGELLYYPADDENILLSSKLELELNTAGTFEFEVPPTNPLYGSIEPRRSMVQVLKDGKEIFLGEVREIEKDFYNVKQVSVTGELAFLFDSIQPQAEYHDMTTRQMLETWLNIHNGQVEDRKKFYVGMVTIHDSNDSLYRYTNRETTLDAIREKLVERLGGYLRIRKEGGKRYLDWITQPEYGKYCEQPIEFGTNLLDYVEMTSAEELATAVIPLGARLEESPIEALEAYTDITSVNNDVDYLYIPEAVERYGWVKKVIHWDDVTEPSNLKAKGEAWLKDNQYEDMTLEPTALDLSELGNEYDAFELGDTVHATAWPYGMNRDFPVRKMTIFLQEPDSNKLELGTTEKKTFSSQVANSNKHFSTELENTRQTTAWLQSAIDNATAMMTGSKGGYKVTEFDDDGRWLRDLYMNAPSKEQASRVMQVNMNGIGFSREGFNGPYKNAWTIDGVLLGEFIKAGSVQSEALSVEYKSSVTNEINTAVTAKFKVAENLISAEVTRATGTEVELAASIKVTSDLVQTKVSKGEFGSYMQQYYNYFLYGFNGNSKYVQINPGEIGIYDNGVTDSKKRSAFDQNGNHFWRDGYYVGKIGTNNYKDDITKKGLNFDLEYNGAYMGWSARDSQSDESYTMKLVYAKSTIGPYTAGKIHAGCEIDMHNNLLRNARFEDGGLTGVINFIQITEMNPDGTAAYWCNASMEFKYGRIVSGTWI